jgi:hypothetical protein
MAFLAEAGTEADFRQSRLAALRPRYARNAILAIWLGRPSRSGACAGEWIEPSWRLARKRRPQIT